MKTINACIAAAIALVLLSCHSQNSYDGTSSASVQDIELGVVAKSEENKSVSADTNGTAPPVLQAGSPASPDWDKKIIKIADVRLELKDYAKYNEAIHKNLKNYGAYIANEEQSQNDDGIENVMTIKVPVDKFEELMNSFTGDDIKVIQKKISTTDVTGEVVDTKGRIEAKKAARAQYIELLKSAKNMKDILEVQNEINSIQEDLESASGRVNYLMHQSSYSTINLTYYQSIGGGTGAFSKVQEAFKTGSSMIVSFILFLVTIWPFILLILFMWLLLKRFKLTFIRAAKKV